MSTQVIVVKRSRRRLFSIPRAVPGLIRALWAARPIGAGGAGGAGKVNSDIRRFVRPGATFPRLGFDSSGQHGCVGCQLCVQICPSRCLVLESEESRDASGEPLRVTRFELTRGSCISCGACRDECPEQAIEMTTGDSVARWADVGRRSKIDLLLIDREIGETGDRSN